MVAITAQDINNTIQTIHKVLRKESFYIFFTIIRFHSTSNLKKYNREI